LKLLNWIIRSCEAEFLYFHFQGQGPVGARAWAACIAAFRFALEIGATFVCEEGKFGIRKISLREECNMNSAPKLWQALKALKSRPPRCYGITPTPPAIR
jgi:hypothetical protein